MRTRPAKIAVISDIHGNLPALEAVVADAHAGGAEEIWNLGDCLGYVPFPTQVLELLKREKAVSIIGNYDLKVLSFPREARAWKANKKRCKYVAFRCNYESLKKKDRKYLKSLPEQLRLTRCGMKVLLTHGSADSIEEPLGPQTPLTRLRELAGSCHADVIACGHSHAPFDRKIAATHFVNPGSVGIPHGNSLSARYAVLDFTEHALFVRHRKVEYDVERAKRAIHAAKQPKELAELFRAWEEQRRACCASARRATEERGPKNKEAAVNAILALARRCDYEVEHTHQVTRLALRLFDELAHLHKMGEEDRRLLQFGSLLHDIGWIRGQKGHHKTAMRLIIGDSTLPLEPVNKKIVALVARYHRKAPPKEIHEYYRDLGPSDRRLVGILAGILRVADGLDRSHCNRVRDLRCSIQKHKILLECDADTSCEPELWASRKKADLLEHLLHRNLVIRVC